MTNEEIRAMVVKVPMNNFCFCATYSLEKPLCKSHARIEALAIQLASRTYNEILQILDRRAAIADGGDVDTGGAVRAELDEAYVEIRALKDSLVGEPIS